MGYSTLLSLSGVAVIGAVIGLQLAESSIGQIDPVHYRGAAVHPRDRGAALDPHAVAPAGPAYLGHYGWAEGRRARAEDCGAACDPVRRDRHAAMGLPEESAWIEPAPPPPPSLFREEQGVRVHRVSGREAIAQRLAEAEAHERRRADIVLYAYYPVSAEELTPKEPAPVPRLPDPVFSDSEY